MNWRKVWVVARHEYVVSIRRAGFIIMTAIIPAVGVVVLLVGAFFSGQARQLGDYLGRQFDVGDKPIGVVDRLGLFTPIQEAYRQDFTLVEDEVQAEAALEAEEVSRVLVIGQDYLETGEVVVMTVGSGFNAAVVEDSNTVRAFLVEHLLAGEVPPELRERAAAPMQVETLVVSSDGQAQEGPWSMAFTFIIPYIMAIFLMMTIFTSSGYLLQGVAEEKESRVIEIVVSSVRPMELMAGKVIGLGAVGMTQVLVWSLSVAGFTGGAVVFLAAAGGASVPVRALVLGVVYYLLGYTLYAILMAGAGALGTTMRESQQLAGMFSFFAAIPYMAGGFVFANPNMPLLRVFSFFPLTAPTMMMMRVSLAEVPWIDVVGSIVVLLISLPVALWLGAKLFRVGLLIYGQRPTLREIWGIVRG